MKRLLLALASFVLVLLSTGCAHPISLSADVATLSGAGVSTHSATLPKRS